MCSHREWGVMSSSHSKDAGVQCSVAGNINPFTYCMTTHNIY